MSPRIMKVAVRSSQHSPMLGQWASSQTECRFHRRISPFRRRKVGPPGARTLSQGGLGESVGRGASRRGRGTPITLVLSSLDGSIMAYPSQAANPRARVSSTGGLREIRTEGVVPKGGLEPPRVAPHAPQTCASANSATSADASRKYAGGLCPCQSNYDGF